MARYILNRYVLILAVIVFAYTAYQFDHIFLQQVNSHYLVERKLSQRVYPHRVNAIGKLQEIWADGFRSFEVDVIYGYNGSSDFQVGHDQGAISDTSLEGLLLSIEFNEIERIWLDLKNLNKDNYLNVMRRLEYLENNYSIKSKVILESSMTLPVFSAFSEKGWHTSYYLPTTEILKAIEADDVMVLEQMASNIASQSETQRLSAVSFDNSLYSFIKDYLEHRISDQIVYHTWWGPSLEAVSFILDLSTDELFLDPRVSSILVAYKSTHDI